MQKIALAVLLALPLAACDNNSKTTTPQDFETVQNEMSANPPAEIITVGQAGDFTVYLPATDALKSVANKEKNSKFKSAELNADHIKEGFCIVDIIPQKVMEDEGTPENTCYYRVFCGAADTNMEELYSVEVCKD
ncbi:MAG: hypothetical protein K2M34_01210 [Alphaproteobacteria bacterium]|nr:hypothetical protein [Alphaproteobacteria bacterium]